MAKIKLQGHASGTGILTVTAPNTSTDRTITLPDATGTLATTADVPSSITDNGDATAITIDSSEKVGIGTSSPARLLSLYGDTGIALQNSTTGTGTGNGTHIWVNSEGSGELLIQNRENSDIEFLTNDTERMRIDSSGNLLVGKTSDSYSVAGIGLRGSVADFTRDGGTSINVNRLSSNGTLIVFHKDDSVIGSIGSEGGDSLYIQGGTTSGAGFHFHPSNATCAPARNGGRIDNTLDLGASSYRWDDVYATNGTIQTSDRNEKQDIEELTEAEQRVAVACKGLMRKFRWKSAVEKKGDEARTHFGIIAQDLQDAFTAEGLDAGDYAMFISTTWWETQTEVPAVEAVAEVTDEDGNVTAEAVEAKDAYIRTDTFDTLEEAPEGATERTRLGVRYPELLAFIISAL